MTRHQQTPAETATTQNESWGFYGTLDRNCEERLDDDRLAALYHEAASQIVQIAGCKLYEAREWLDSTRGRHLADQVSPQVDADEELDLAKVSWLAKQLRRDLDPTRRPRR